MMHSAMPTALLVALGGVAGVLARYGLTVWVQSIWTVVAINLLGSLLLGLLTSAGGHLSTDVRTALGVGVLGGFTTLSTLTVQTVLEADGGRPATAALYFAVSTIGGLACAGLGYALGRALA
jgi:CrcB protein